MSKIWALRSEYNFYYVGSECLRVQLNEWKYNSTSAGNTIQKRGISPGSSWSVWKKTFWHRCWGSHWTHFLWTEKDCWVMWLLEAVRCTVIMKSSKKKERVFLLGEVRSRTVTLDFQSLVCLGDWLKELFGRQSWKAKESRRTGNFPRRKSWRWTSPLSSCADGREGEILDEQICLEFRVKRWVYDIWKQGQVTQVVRLCREYIRRSKVQLELNLNSAAKETKKCFYKYICNKMKG